MSLPEAVVGLLLVATVGALTRRAVKRQLGKPTGEVADTPPASVPLLGVVPPPRTEAPLDAPVIRP